MPCTYLGENVYVRYLEECLELRTIIDCEPGNMIVLRPSMFSMLWGYVNTERRNLNSEKIALGGGVFADLDNDGDLTLTLEQDGQATATIFVSPGVWTALMKYIDRHGETVVHKKAGAR